MDSLQGCQEHSPYSGDGKTSPDLVTHLRGLKSPWLTPTGLSGLITVQNKRVLGQHLPSSLLNSIPPTLSESWEGERR